MKTAEELREEFISNWAPYNMSGPGRGRSFDEDFDLCLKTHAINFADHVDPDFPPKEKEYFAEIYDEWIESKE